jgi:predicted amidohydrolase
VLPEVWTTSLLARYDAELIAASLAADERIVKLSEQLDMVVVGGGVEEQGGKIYNRALVVEKGVVRGIYRKIHLFSANAEHKAMRHGTSPLIVDTACGRIGVVICYDLRFPELVRWYFDQEIEILAVPAQWPDARAEHWRTLVRARAIENEIFVLGCNRCGPDATLKTGEPLHFPGDSRIVDPMGEVLAAGSGESSPILAEIEPRRVRMMRRVLPIAKDRRPEVYSRIWQTPWSLSHGNFDA